MTQVEFSADTVVKVDAPDLIAVEAEKMARASKIGLVTGYFTVPEIIDYDRLRGRLVMRRLHDYKPLREIAFARSERQATYLKLGRALSAVHKQLDLPAGMRHMVPKVLEGPGPCRFLHGDLSTVNVGMSRGELVILDWQFTRIHGGRATYGPAYFDCVWLINNIFSRPLHRCLGRWDPEGDAGAFVQGYFGERPDNSFDKYQSDFFKLTASRRLREFWLKSWLLRYGQRRWCNYVSRG